MAKQKSRKLTDLAGGPLTVAAFQKMAAACEAESRRYAREGYVVLMPAWLLRSLGVRTIPLSVPDRELIKLAEIHVEPEIHTKRR